MKPVRFIGDSQKQIRGFPAAARRKAGFQLERLQRGEQPDDFKPLLAIGKGVEELRISTFHGAFRVIYYARLANGVYVLHAFQKKSQATPRSHIELAKARYRKVIQNHASQTEARGL